MSSLLLSSDQDSLYSMTSFISSDSFSTTTRAPLSPNFFPYTVFTEKKGKKGRKKIPSNRHEKYYFDDGNIVFKVEDKYFRVHRYFFLRDSLILRETLATAASGDTENNAITFDDIKVADFEHLLWMFYNPTYTNHRATEEAWSSILMLADRWDMRTIRAVAIEELGKLSLDPVAKIALCEQYAIPKEWAMDAYVALCARIDPLNVEEMKRVGWDAVQIVGAGREKVAFKRGEWPYQPTRAPSPAWGYPRSPSSIQAPRDNDIPKSLVNDIVAGIIIKSPKEGVPLEL